MLTGYLDEAVFQTALAYRCLVDDLKDRILILVVDRMNDRTRSCVEGTAFSSVVQSNRQTEADIRASGLDWAIGRNGMYIEPDVEYIDNYRAKGEIANSAGDGKCGYTTRSELAHAYAALLTQDDLNGQTFNLNGKPISQDQLAEHLNAAFGTNLTYRAMSSAEFVADRTEELGYFIGPIIGGIYEGISKGTYDRSSDFEAVTGRPHQAWDDYFSSLAK